MSSLSATECERMFEYGWEATTNTEEGQRRRRFRRISERMAMEHWSILTKQSLGNAHTSNQTHVFTLHQLSGSIQECDLLLRQALPASAIERIWH